MGSSGSGSNGKAIYHNGYIYLAGDINERLGVVFQFEANNITKPLNIFYPSKNSFEGWSSFDDKYLYIGGINGYIYQLDKKRPIKTIHEDVTSDVVIMGGGIAGISTAFFVLKYLYANYL